MADRRVVPIDFLDQVERATLEMLAITLYREERLLTGETWGSVRAAVRDDYRGLAQQIMQGEEPKKWRK